MIYTLQRKDDCGRWMGSRNFRVIYQTLEEAVGIAKEIDEHGNSIRVVSFANEADAYRGKGPKVAWSAR